MAHKPAGGIGSRNVVSKPVKTGVGARAVSKKWVSQIGSSQGNRAQIAETGGGGKILHGVRAYPYRGTGYRPAKFGNDIATNVGGGGPGTGRQVFKSGSQHGLQPARSMPKGRSFDV